MTNESQNTGPTPGIDPEELRLAVDRVIDDRIGINPALLTPEERDQAVTGQEAIERPNPFDNPLFRREAGEGWSEGEVSKKLLGAIIAREAISNELANVQDQEERDIIMEEYRSQAEYVESLKQGLGIGEAPPRTDP